MLLHYLVPILLIFPQLQCGWGQSNSMVVFEKLEYKRVAEVGLQLHVFRPSNAVDAPVVVFLHPGGWVSGSPEFFHRECQQYAEQGFVMISVGYRLANHRDITPVDCLEDVRAALDWIADHPQELGVDTSRVALIGYSAGGHLALMSQLTENPSRLKAKELLLFATPVNLTNDKLALELMGSAEVVRALSPAYHSEKISANLTFFHGKKDDIVPCSTVASFVEVNSQAKASVRLFSFDHTDHFILSDGKIKPEIDREVGAVLSGL